MLQSNRQFCFNFKQNPCMEFSYITYAVANRVATITLNRPEKRNALNGAMVAELRHAFRLAGADGNAKIILLKANGQAFCAGADLDYLKQLQQNTYEENLQDSRELSQLFQEIYDHEKVVIAQVEGHAVAGGCGLVTVCDLSFVTSEALLGYSEVKIGFIPALVSVFLVRKVGEGRARKWLLTGSLYTAEQALQDGLITAVAAPSDLETQVNLTIADLLEGTAAHSLTTTKKLVNRVLEMPLPDALEYAAQFNAETRENPACRRGIQSFLNKEKLKW